MVAEYLINSSLSLLEDCLGNTLAQVVLGVHLFRQEPLLRFATAQLLRKAVVPLEVRFERLLLWRFTLWGRTRRDFDWGFGRLAKKHLFFVFNRGYPTRFYHSLLACLGFFRLVNGVLLSLPDLRLSLSPLILVNFL